jgi:hypothetical protein
MNGTLDLLAEGPPWSIHQMAPPRFPAEEALWHEALTSDALLAAVLLAEPDPVPGTLAYRALERAQAAALRSLLDYQASRDLDVDYPNAPSVP